MQPDDVSSQNNIAPADPPATNGPSQEPTGPASIPVSTPDTTNIIPEAPEGPTDASPAIPSGIAGAMSPPESGSFQGGESASNLNFMHGLFAKAEIAIANRKRKKLEKVMGALAKQARLANSDVQKISHVSHATATRYLDELEKEGRIVKNGKGEGVYYTIAK